MSFDKRSTHFEWCANLIYRISYRMIDSYFVLSTYALRYANIRYSYAHIIGYLIGFIGYRNVWLKYVFFRCTVLHWCYFVIMIVDGLCWVSGSRHHYADLHHVQVYVKDMCFKFGRSIFSSKAICIDRVFGKSTKIHTETYVDAKIRCMYFVI